MILWKFKFWTKTVWILFSRWDCIVSHNLKRLWNHKLIKLYLLKILLSVGDILYSDKIANGILQLKEVTKIATNLFIKTCQYKIIKKFGKSGVRQM